MDEFSFCCMDDVIRYMVESRLINPPLELRATSKTLHDLCGYCETSVEVETFRGVRTILRPLTFSLFDKFFQHFDQYERRAVHLLSIPSYHQMAMHGPDREDGTGTRQEESARFDGLWSSVIRTIGYRSICIFSSQFGFDFRR